MNKEINNKVEADVAKTERQPKKEAKKAKLRRWSVADTVVALIVLLAIVGTVGRLVFFGGDDAKAAISGDGVTYRVEYTVDEIYEAAADSIKALDGVFLYETGDRIGYIARYDDYTPVIKKMYIAGEGRSDGEHIKVALEGMIFCDNAVMRDGCLFISDGGKYIAPGSQLALSTETALLNVRIVSISAVE